MTLLYLVRHGQTDWNLQRRIQGSTDIALNDTGRAQAARAGQLLARRHWDVLASSPLSRAYETAEIIGGYIALPSDNSQLTGQGRAEISHDSTEPESDALCPVVSVDIMVRS